MNKDIYAAVSAYICDKRLLDTGDKVLCALSGGADSVALLLLLKELEGRLGIKVFAAHLNHGIRGNEADRDEHFCAELCDKIGVPFISERVDVPVAAKERKMGLEAAAREVRYEFLSSACIRFGCNKIATAHHADDNIETVLLHMLRGCGLNGLKGISPIRGNIIRPLLAVRKQELEAFLADKGVSFVHDSTNDELDCTRNYIRHKILPHIYEINESADKAFARMCDAIAEDDEYISAQARCIPENASREQLAVLEGSLLCRYIILLYEKKTGKTGISAESTRLIAKAVKDGKTVKYAIQGDVNAYVSASGVDFVTDKKILKTDEEFSLDFGENIISPIGYRILITRDKNTASSFTKIYKAAICNKIKCDKITKDGKLKVTVRTRKAGDRYTFGNMSRDVRRQLINFKIPSQERDSLPVFCVSGEIFYVYGLRIADGYAESGDENCIYIAASKL